MKKILLSLALVTAANSALAVGHKIVAESFACQSKDFYSKTALYAAQGDRDAFVKSLGAGILTGECIMLEPGQKIFISDTELLSGLVRLRKPGETVEYWTDVSMTE
ncbi:hypothetical protein [Endozoicomonas sp. 4G]|uniref:hypothetical protein n=1 Tax=Endozoicomonas sp. 4G TaxID=2872754 RepID=UPI002078F1AA|nr:hypothetical protein [Endozoicomonas sp. 4G]